MGSQIRCWVLGAAAIFLLLVFLFLPVGGSGESSRFDPALLKTVSSEQPPLQFLRDFNLIPGSVATLGDSSMMALFENAGTGLYALVIFVAECDAGRCLVQDTIAYLFNPRDLNGEVAMTLASA